MVIAAGQKIRASEINDVTPIFGYVTADQSKTSNTTLANITGLSASLEANSVYALDGYLSYNSAEAGDLKVAITVPTGTTGHWGLYGMSPATVTTTSAGDLQGMRIDAFGDANTASVGGSGWGVGALICLPRGYVATSSTAGTLQFRFAQQTSSSTATIIKTGAWIRIWKIA